MVVIPPDSPKLRQLRVEPVRKAEVPTDEVTSPGKIEANPGTVGIFGYSYLEENRDRVRGITINGVSPTYETISSFKYPGARPLFIYIKNARANAIPAMLLLPLARWAVDGAAAALKLVAKQGNGVLEISLRSDLATAVGAETEDIAGVRERLAHLYGNRATLEASSAPHLRHAFIALPV